MSETIDVVTFGEAMILLVADEVGPLDTVSHFHKRIAGAEINVAIGLARLGLEVGWGSRLGDDSMGRHLLRELKGEGVDCSHVVVTSQARTGMMLKGRVDDGSDPPTEYFRAGSAASRMTTADVDDAWLAGTRHLHVSGVFPAVSPDSLGVIRHAIQVVRRAGGTITFDPNLRPSLWSSTEVMRDTLNELADSCDTVLPGVGEGKVLVGSEDPATIARFYRERGARRVIVKLGPLGAYYDDAEQGTGTVPAFPVAKVVDTVGAGDGFAVGVISALLAGRSTADAARRGAWIGARAVQVVGDSEGLPTREELEAAGL